MNALRKKTRDSLFGLLIVLPALSVFLFMILYPFLSSVAYSFTNKHLLFPRIEFVGFQNYAKIIGDPYFFQLLSTTGIFVFFSTLCPFILGFVWAVIMNLKFRGSEFIRGVTLINWIIPGIAIGFLWSWVFNGDYGILNAVLNKFGLIDENIRWLGSSKTAMATVVTARTWQMFPWYMAFILGGLQGVSNDQLEAAKIDGANNFQIFINIVLPAVASVVSLILILGTIGNLQHFDLINVMTDGGPERSTRTFAIFVYKTAFKEYEIGLSAALGVIWALILGLFSFIYLRRIRED